MIPVKIVKIGEPITKPRKDGKGNYTKINYTVTDNLGNTLVVSKFASDKDPHVEVGMEVLMDITKNGQYINCEKIELFEALPEPPVVEKTEKPAVPNEVWEKKDACMRRMNALSHAVQIVKYYFEATGQKPEVESEITNLVIVQAAILASWINDGNL